MQQQFAFYRPQVLQNGDVYLVGADTTTVTAASTTCRPIMLTQAISNNQCLRHDTISDQWRKMPMSEWETRVTKYNKMADTTEQLQEMNPVMNFIHNEAVHLRPRTLIMSDLKWKYLVRSAMRGKNILMTGHSGSGKTVAAKSLVKALNRPDFYFNLGATQDPRGTLIGNTHFVKDTGTVFHESVFVKAIQTENAIILLDELSRAHPEAWNILMTVLDDSQRYLRLDEHPDAPCIPVAPGVTFIATANIGNEYTSTRVMDRAMLDRFVIIEMEHLNHEQEKSLLMDLYPNIDIETVDAIAEIAFWTRKELRSETSKISTSISTRISVEIAGLINDGFSLQEAAEICIFPFFDEAGGVESERTYVKQLVQKYIKSETEDSIF